MISACIGIGSNLGSVLRQMRDAYAALASLPDARLAAASAIYRTAAVGPGDQPDYLNAVVALHTAMPADALLEVMHNIEAQAGREREEPWGARTLDLDLLLYGNVQISTPELTVPHPRIFERNFVLLPLSDICPASWCFPDGSRLDDRLLACPDNPIERTTLDWGHGAPADAEEHP